MLVVSIMILPFYIWFMLHWWAKRRIKDNPEIEKLKKEIEKLKYLAEIKEKTYTEKICKVESDVDDWKRVSDRQDKRLAEIKRTWKSPFGQQMEINMKSIPINKIYKLMPEQMTEKELEACVDYYIKLKT